MEQASMINETWDVAALSAELAFDEGRAAKPYHDTKGKISIGIGRNLTDVGLSPAEIDLLFRNDVARAVADLDNHASWWRKLDPPRQRVMINLTFNMGWTRFSAFQQFFAFMRAGDYAGAANDLTNTAWFSQVGSRGPRMLERLDPET